GWLRRYGLAECDADDLAQDILLVVLRELPYFHHNRRTGAFRNWLRRIVVHRYQDFIRAKRYRPLAGGDSEFSEQLLQLEDPDSSLSRHWDQEHDQHVVRKLLALIERDYQEATWNAFCGVMLSGEAPAKVATRLGISVNSVLLAKSRVLARLRQEGQGLL